MNLRARTALGALVACALAICAFGAATAAASGGLTAVECVEKGAGGRFKSSHCVTTGEEGSFETRAIKPLVQKEVEGTDTYDKAKEGKEGHELGETDKPGAVLHGVLNGINVTVTCGKGQTTGAKIENKEEVGEMKAHVTEAVVHWTECHASPESQATKVCNVQGTSPATVEGEITTNKLTAITGAEHKVTIKPQTGDTFTEFKILKKGTGPNSANCFTGFDLAVKVTGQATGTANTQTHSHLTISEPWPCGVPGQPACGELKANGNKAAQTETVTGFTKGNKDATVGATTESEIKETES